MPTVSVDTSALMLPVELDVRLFDELERLLGEVTPLVHRSVVDELEALSSDRGRTGRAATVGLRLVEATCQVVGEVQPITDDAVLELVVDGPAEYLVTADRELAARARSADIPTITPRGRRQLAIQHP